MPSTAPAKKPGPASAPSSSSNAANANAADAAILDHELLSHLANTPALEDLHNTLLFSLQRCGWTERIRSLALELLRCGRCERFDEVMETVIGLVVGDEAVAGSFASTKNGEGENGHDPSQSQGEVDEQPLTNGYTPVFGDVDVRIPESVVGEGVRVLKEALGEILVVEGESEDEREEKKEKDHVEVKTNGEKKKKKPHRNGL